MHLCLTLTTLHLKIIVVLFLREIAHVLLLSLLIKLLLLLLLLIVIIDIIDVARVPVILLLLLPIVHLVLILRHEVIFTGELHHGLVRVIQSSAAHAHLLLLVVQASLQ